jgi:hypothetical protein
MASPGGKRAVVACVLAALAAGAAWWALPREVPAVADDVASPPARDDADVEAIRLASLPPLDDAALAAPLEDWYALARRRALAGDADARWLLARATGECLRVMSPQGVRRASRTLEERLEEADVYAPPPELQMDAEARARAERARRGWRINARVAHAHAAEARRSCVAIGASAVEEALDWWEPFAVNGGLEERAEFAGLLNVFANEPGRALRHLEALQRRVALAEGWMRDAARAGEGGAALHWLTDQYWPGGFGSHGRALLPADPYRYTVYALARLDPADGLALAEAEADVLRDINDMAPRHGLPQVDADAFAAARAEAVLMRERSTARQEREARDIGRRVEARMRARSEGRPLPPLQWEERTAWQEAEARALAAREARLRAQAEADEAAAEAEAQARGDAAP